MASPRPTQFFTEAFAGVSYDEDPQKALQGLDEWEIPESIYRKDGSCMSIWELARVNGNYISSFRTIGLRLTCVPRISLRRRPQ